MLKEKSLEMGAKHGWGLILIKRDELRSLLAKLFEERGRLDILEIGAYKCFLMGWIREQFPDKQWSYTGADIVDLPDKLPGCKLYVMNAEALEFPPNSFDLVIMVEVLEHVIDYVKALREIHRVLKPGGALFIQSVIATSPSALADETHFHVLHPATLKRLLEWLGFRNVEYVEDGNFAIWGYK